MADTLSVQVSDHLQARISAKKKDRLIQMGACLGALACLVAAGMLITPINEERKQYQLTVNPDELSGLPPDIALLTRTGTLRLLAMNMAFSRIERLKEEGKFYELMQLSSWVCKLAPLYPNVWSYAAWNQAYNISVSEYNPEARWKWVRNGISLLRDQGIQYNPKAIVLYKELSWIYWHKVADFADDAHFFYKAHLAVDWESVLGDQVVLTEDDAKNLIRVIHEAPADPQALIESNAAVGQLVERLAEVELRPDRSLLEFVAREMRQIPSAAQLQLETKEVDEEAKLRERRVAVLTDSNAKEAVDRLLASIRHKVIREDMKLDTEWMLKLMDDYGPLDWRNAYAHSLYWSTRGDMITKGQLNLDPSDSMNTVRFIFFALMNSIERGRIVLQPNWDDPGRSFMDLLPDLRFIPYLFDAYIRLGSEQFQEDPRWRPNTPGFNYWAGFINWVREAIQRLYFEGGAKNLALANEYLTYLRTMHTNDDGTLRSEYQMSLDEFAMEQIKDVLVTFKDTQALIQQMLIRSLRELSLGNEELAANFTDHAAKIWAGFMKENQGYRNIPQPMQLMLSTAVVAFMQNPTVPLNYKAVVWQKLGEKNAKIQQMSYDEAIKVVKVLCERNVPPFDPAKVLPEPAGMEAYRENPVKGLDRYVKDVEQGEKKFEAP